MAEASKGADEKGDSGERPSRRKQVARALSSNPVRPAWGLSLGGIVAAGLGFWVATHFLPTEAALGAGISALLVAAIGLASPRGLRAKAAPIAGAIVLLALLLAHFSTGSPLVAALAMGAVMFVSALSIAGGRVVAVIGTVLGTAYFVPAIVGYTTDISTLETLLSGAIGVAAGLVTVGLLAHFVRPIDTVNAKSATPDSGLGQTDSGPLGRILAAAKTRSPLRSYAFRRAIVVGAAVGVYQVSGNHNAFWVALTLFAVLGPDEASTWEKALNRSVGTIAGALFLGALAQVLDPKIVIGLGVAAPAIGVAFLKRNYAVYSAGMAMLVVALFGASEDQFLGWAGLRILDTVIGATIALASLYLIPSRKGDTPDDETSSPGPAGQD